MSDISDWGLLPSGTHLIFKAAHTVDEVDKINKNIERLRLL